MSHVYADRTKQDCSAPTGSAAFDFSASTSETGFVDFVAALADADTCKYAAEDSSGNWEVGIGTWAETGETLARTSIEASSNAGAAETFTGTVTVRIVTSAAEATNTYRRANWGCFLTGSTTQSLTSGASEPIEGNGTGHLIDTVEWDANSMVSYTSDLGGTNAVRFTPPAGFWRLTVLVQFATAGDAVQHIVRAYKNGVLLQPDLFRTTIGGSSVVSGAGSRLIEANGTDYFNIAIYQNSGSAMDIPFAELLWEFVRS